MTLLANPSQKKEAPGLRSHCEPDDEGQGTYRGLLILDAKCAMKDQHLRYAGGKATRWALLHAVPGFSSSIQGWAA